MRLGAQGWCTGMTLRHGMGRVLAVQGTFKSLLQHHSSKASILWCSAFFIVQLSHPYVTTGKTIALTRRTFVGKVMSLLFNMVSILLDYLGLYNRHITVMYVRIFFQNGMIFFVVVY